MHGPKRLSQPQEWPVDIVTTVSQKTKAEVKVVKEIFNVAIKEEDECDEMDQLMKKFDHWTTIRQQHGCSASYIMHARVDKNQRLTGPLTTKETDRLLQWWIKRVQSKNEKRAKFKADQEQLNLKKNAEGDYEYRGRMQGDYPIYLPDGEVFTEKLVLHAHKISVHGGVGLTMTKLREKSWVPRLRRLTKRLIRSCLPASDSRPLQPLSHLQVTCQETEQMDLRPTRTTRKLECILLDTLSTRERTRVKQKPTS